MSQAPTLARLATKPEKDYAGSIAESAYAESTTETIYVPRPSSCPPSANPFDESDEKKSYEPIERDFRAQAEGTYFKLSRFQLTLREIWLQRGLLGSTLTSHWEMT
jgi:hypothetical protein